MATITVRGEGAAPGQPDEIVVALELSAVRAAAQDAHAEVGAQSEALSGLCDELGIAGAARSTAGVSVQEHREYDDRGRPEPRGYVASNRVLVRVADAVLVGRLLREAVTRSAARASGPWWRLAAEKEIPVSPGELDVRAAVEVTFALEDA